MHRYAAPSEHLGLLLELRGVGVYGDHGHPGGFFVEVEAARNELGL